jgi:hypothetical protein
MPTYEYSDSLSTDKDQVRDQLGITDISGGVDTALISDEHIIAALSALGSTGAAVAYLARELAARFAQLPTSIRSGQDALAWANRVSTWLALAGLAEGAVDGSASPASGLLTTTAPIAPPTPYEPDANSGLYRGSPYLRRWRP